MIFLAASDCNNLYIQRRNREALHSNLLLPALIFNLFLPLQICRCENCARSQRGLQMVEVHQK